ncbi:MAG: sucrose phosphorylase [Vicinamibacterales bacterium]
MKNKVQLITYVDRLSQHGLDGLLGLFRGALAGLFGGVHLLPFFHPIDGADAGFDPIDHTLVDPRLGTWDDVRVLSQTVSVMADVIVNHVSAKSAEFLDFSAHGSASKDAGLFLTMDRVFPQGMREEDLLRIYRPRPSLPFTMMPFRDGSRRVLWTTFTAEQIDIDVLGGAGRDYLQRILTTLGDAGIAMVRLDAAGYAIKRAGTSCFMLPETFDFIADLAARARTLGIEILVEIHAHFQQQIEIARHVDRVYDFALPPLVLHALYQCDARPLRQWLAISPRNAVTVLDTHDGIGVHDVGADRSGPVERPGLLPPHAIDALVEEIHRRSGGGSRKATGAAASNLDLYQVNCTYYDALGGVDRDYLLARAIQFFAPGVPQIYYVGLLAGRNDIDLLHRTGVGRDINRHYYSEAELSEALRRPIVQQLFDLIRFRNAHPAFDGEFAMPDATDQALCLEWRNGDGAWASLDVDLRSRNASIRWSGSAGEEGQWTL